MVERTGGADPGPAHGRPGSTPLDERCAALVRALRENCPGVLPDARMPPGKAGGAMPIDPKSYSETVRVAARQGAAMAASGRLPASDDELPEVTIWREGIAALAVGVRDMTVSLDEGSITVALPVWCDQLPDAQDVVRVTFVVGSPDRPAGLIAATTGEPEGPPLVIRTWGEQLTALAWQAVLDTAATIAAQAGTDADGAPLVATALAAAPDRLEVLPQARQPFDRMPNGRAVTP